MKSTRKYLPALLLLLIVLNIAGCSRRDNAAQTVDKMKNEQIDGAIRAVMDAQAAAWNRGDIQTKASVFYLHGSMDEFYPPARVASYAEQLRRRATDVEMKSYAAGHEIIAEMREDIRAWLREKASMQIA